MKRNSLVLILFCQTFLFACLPTSTPTPTQPLSSATLDALEPSITFPPHATLTFTSFSVSSTPIPTQTPLPSPTPLPVDPPEEGYWNYSISPNDEWVAWQSCCIQEGNVGNFLEVAKLDGTLRWRLEYEHEKYGGFAGVVVPVHWSVNGVLLYLTVTPERDYRGFYQGYTGFQRLNLITGDVEDVIPPGNYELAVSPNGEYFVYAPARQTPLTLLVQRLDDGTKQSVILDEIYAAVGDFVWSSDNERFVFTTLVEQDFRVVEANIWLSSTSELQNLTNFLSFEDMAFVDSWTNGSSLLIRHNGQNFSFNIETGELVEN